MGERISIYVQTEMLNTIDSMAEAENRSRSNMVSTLLERSINQLKAAMAANQPYPAVPEAPADCDAQ